MGESVSGWMPIESAPKDGTWFVAYRPEPKLGTWSRVLISRWLEETEAFVFVEEAFDIYRDDIEETNDRGYHRWHLYELGNGPLHWMPLPDPPEDPQ